MVLDDFLMVIMLRLLFKCIEDDDRMPGGIIAMSLKLR